MNFKLIKLEYLNASLQKSSAIQEKGFYQSVIYELIAFSGLRKKYLRSL